MDNGIEIEVWFAFTRDSEEVEFLRYLLAAQIARKFVHPTDKGIPWAELVAIREGADTITIIGNLKWLGAIGFNTQAGTYWGVSDFGQEILDRLEKQPKITVTRNECY